MDPDLTLLKEPLLSHAVEDVLYSYDISSVIIKEQNINTHLQEPNVDAVISFVKCMVKPTSKRNVNDQQQYATLIFITENCKNMGTTIGGSVIPVYVANDIRKYSCVSHVISSYFKYCILRRTNLLGEKFIRSYRKTINTEEANTILRGTLRVSFTEEFMNCLNEAFTPEVKKRTEAERGRSALNGKNLLITTINRPPFLILQTGGLDGREIINWKGSCIDMLNCLAEKFNFSYKLVFPPDMNWGAPTPNGTYNGMVGMVQRKEVDFAIASLTITYLREQTWFCLGITVIIFTLFLFVFSSYSKSQNYLYPHNTKRHLKEGKIFFLPYLWGASFILIGQGVRVKQTNCSRILLGFWISFSMIMMLSYTGTLIAFLTVPTLERTINSLEELSNQKNMLWTYRANTVYDNLFGEAEPGGTYYKIGQLLVKNPELRVRSEKEGVEAVLYNEMAYIKEKSYLDLAMERDYTETGKCRLAQAEQTFFSAGFGWALQEGSPYLQLFNDVFLRMEQHGLFLYFKQRYWPKPNECTAGQSSAPLGPRALALDDLIGHFLILGTGLFLACVSFVLENVIHQQN